MLASIFLTVVGGVFLTEPEKYAEYTSIPLKEIRVIGIVSLVLGLAGLLSLFWLLRSTGRRKERIILDDFKLKPAYNWIAVLLLIETVNTAYVSYLLFSKHILTGTKYDLKWLHPLVFGITVLVWLGLIYSFYSENSAATNAQLDVLNDVFNRLKNLKN
jgi:hypothetical protein